MGEADLINRSLQESRTQPGLGYATRTATGLSTSSGLFWSK
jgi:hypothetical protein